MPAQIATIKKVERTNSARQSIVGSKLCLFIGIIISITADSFLRTQVFLRTQLARMAQCKRRSAFRLELRQPMAPALPVDERRLRHVAVRGRSQASFHLPVPKNYDAAITSTRGHIEG
jgi:hypothetical protein